MLKKHIRFICVLSFIIGCYVAVSPLGADQEEENMITSLKNR